MRRAIGLLVVAALIGVVRWLWGLALPSWLETVQPDNISTAFQVASTASYILDVLAVVLVAIAAVLLARAEPAARLAKWLAIASAMLAVVRIPLPYVLPNPYAEGSWVDHTYYALRVGSELFRSATMFGIALTLRRLAGVGRIADAALALALLVVVDVPALLWSWVIGPLAIGWGFRINGGARVVLFAIVAIAMRKKVTR